MRFLCLHGRGTSAKIFEMQTAKIREGLGREHEFIFVNGTIPTEPDGGAATVTDEYFAYVGDNVTQYRELCDGLMELVESQGPFDGLMGFSEGGAVAALMLIQDSRHAFGDFQCAIFFSGALPFDPDVARTGDVRWVDPTTDGVLLNIPTAHMWSKTGDVNSERARSLAQLCEENLREVFLHDLGHDIPGSRSDVGLTGALRIIEHTIERARSRSM